MESKEPSSSPALACKLGLIRFGPATTKPLGGLNPYCQEYKSIGDQFAIILKRHARLRPESAILDLGCGTGRLIKSIQPSPNYVGFDINRHFIEYCATTYTGNKFVLSDIYNEEFNDTGSIPSAEAVLPFPDNSFDIVASFGVFNHLDIQSVLRYVDESARVLKRNGFFVFTALLLNDYSLGQIKLGLTKAPFKFSYPDSGMRYEHKDRRYLNIAIEEQDVRRRCLRNKLAIQEPLRYGQWCNSHLAISGHDVIVAKKIDHTSSSKVGIAPLHK
jgi:SAM-dependent methyltransferase